MTRSEPLIYAQCGLLVRSEVELHLPIALGDGFDVDVRWGADIADSSALPPGEVIAAYGSEEDSWYTATATESGFLLRFRECGEFAISADLSAVEVRPDPTGRPELLPILLAGTVTAFVLTLRGETVLHASAVALDGVALAFVGQSGRGKSTVAALLCLDGAELVTDDVLAVDTGPPVTCTGGAPELRLRDGAAILAESQPDARTRVTADDRLALALRVATLEPVPLAAIVIPAPSHTVTDVEIRRLPPSTAVFWLLAFPRVHGWCRPDVLSRDFAVISQIADTIPVYDVTIPWGPPFDPGVAQSLAALAAREAPAA